MRLLICAGGTGGGVYPALAVAQAVQNDPTAYPDDTIAPHELLWIGGEGGMEAALVQRAGLPFRAIPAAGLHGVGLRVLPGNLLRLARGVLAAYRILSEFRPDGLLFTGGYIAPPVALANALRFGNAGRSVVYVPDIEPGLALKFVAQLANHIAVTVADSRAYFSASLSRRVVVTGYPVRPDLTAWDKAAARQSLGLSVDNTMPVVLFFGGSKGARSINQALLAILPDLLAKAEVIHINGQDNWAAVEQAKQALPAELSARYHAFPYLHEQMGAALTAADLVVSRAGASCLGEFPLFGLPAILVPYPYAWRYQRLNAEYLASRGAAILLPDSALSAPEGQNLASLLHDLLSEPGRARLAQMAAAMTAVSPAAQPAGQAATRIAHLLSAPPKD